MKSLYFKSFAVPLCLLLLSGCENPVKKLPLGVIGGTEPVYVEPFRTPFSGKVDTGADIASIGATNIREFRKDGKRYVAFTIVQRGTDAVQNYELPLVRVIPITRHGQKPLKRYVVHLRIRLGTLEMTREFSLADRSNFKYQVLLGKNVIAGNAAVDVTRENTLEPRRD